MTNLRWPTAFILGLVGVGFLFGVLSLVFWWLKFPPINYWIKSPNDFDQCLEARRVVFEKGEGTPRYCYFRGREFVNPDYSEHIETPSTKELLLESGLVKAEYPSKLFFLRQGVEQLPIEGFGTTSATQLVHRVGVPYCDLSGLPDHCKTYTEDMTVGFSIVETPLIELRKQLSVWHKSVLSKRVGDNELNYVEVGAVGEGRVYYLIPMGDSRTLVVAHGYVTDKANSDLSGNDEYLIRDKQSEIIYSILKSIKY